MIESPTLFSPACLMEEPLLLDFEGGDDERERPSSPPLEVLVAVDAMMKDSHKSTISTIKKKEAKKSRKRSTSSDSESHADGHENSSGSGNGSGEGAFAGKAKKVRTPTHTLRRQEKEALLKEVEALENQVGELKERAEERLTEKELLNAILRETRRDQQLSFAVAQSAVSGFLNGEDSNPLHMYIHLGKDWSERHKTLLGMKEKKIENAFAYAHARSKFLDPLKPHRAEERYENANGDYCCTRFDLIQFEGVQSVKQVYDALLFYLLNIEISVSERLGHITVREDYDNMDQSISNCRLQSTLFGRTVETNLVTFAKFIEHHELSDGEPCGILTFDCVDEDELYPYTPKERVRKDVAQTVVLTPQMRKTRNGHDGEEELVVVMAIGKFLKLYNAEFDIPGPAVQGLRDSMCWGPVMVTTINELLHPEFFSPVSPGNNNLGARKA